MNTSRERGECASPIQQEAAKIVSEGGLHLQAGGDYAFMGDPWVEFSADGLDPFLQQHGAEGTTAIQEALVVVLEGRLRSTMEFHEAMCDPEEAHVFRDHLDRFLDGVPITLYLPTDKPITYQSGVIDGAQARFPRGIKLALQKPTTP